MRDCVRWAVQKGVSIGAHPSFHDPENFGRKEMQLPAGDIYAGVLYQLGALSAIAQAQGASGRQLPARVEAKKEKMVRRARRAFHDPRSKGTAAASKVGEA